MPDKELTKATIVNAFTDTELFSLGLFKNGTLKTYICVKNDSIEVLYQRISTLVLTVLQEVNHEVI